MPALLKHKNPHNKCLAFLLLSFGVIYYIEAQLTLVVYGRLKSKHFSFQSVLEKRKEHRKCIVGSLDDYRVPAFTVSPSVAFQIQEISDLEGNDPKILRFCLSGRS